MYGSTTLCSSPSPVSGEVDERSESGGGGVLVVNPPNKKGTKTKSPPPVEQNPRRLPHQFHPHHARHTVDPECHQIRPACQRAHVDSTGVRAGRQLLSGYHARNLVAERIMDLQIDRRCRAEREPELA